MNLHDLLENKLGLAITSALIGALISIIAQYFANKRGVFSYNVWHNKIGVSADDAVYGSVKVTWNDTSINHLYLSTVEVKNESIKDYENVVIRVFTNDTDLLTERTSMVGTTRIIYYASDYAEKLEVPNGEEPSANQFSLYRSQRDYTVPTMNRGQLLRFEFLNAAKTDEDPNIWLDILHKGVTCKFRPPARLIYGVSQSRAVIVGTIICIIGVILTITTIKSQIAASFISFFLGWITLVPGALAIKGFRAIRGAVTG